ncbi:MAG TPA: efflux RND transporter periplasmic adaptor subunit [Treponemataceae bacterium]|jgi:membrane fusion protein (multidrug efflux system)|nr:efflux RND transporter periplasmic adaptor subunit [Treponema sp.]OQB04301.1 MAG: Cation efflux system protein CusB precursor [Spirochaetes bacterium ADurb.Bin215]HPA09917.1 efflux RND transporter periplasmic adaptor subunit [Treponemataceae bacterium]
MNKSRFRRYGIMSILAVLSITMLSCSKDKSDKDASAAEEAEAVVFAVTTVTATRGELNDYLEFGGDVVAKSNLDILPDAAGKIAQVLVSVGDTVKKDQVIAYVDPSRPGMNYEYSPVKSPISGTITAVNVVPGSMVAQQLSIAKVSKMETLEVIMNVPERFVSKVKLDQKAYLKFDAYPGETFLAEVSEVSPVLDQASRTMGVKLSFIAKDPRIKAGMFARVKLITDIRSNVVKIPETAIVNRFGENFVFMVVPGEKPAVRKQLVSVGIRVDEKAEVLSGLSPDAEVVVRGQTLLEEGSLINIVSRMQPLPEQESIQ